MQYMVVLVLVFVAVILAAVVRPCASQTQIAQSLFHQMARWSTAATQDENPMVAVLHANYGVGYMMSLQSIAAEDELERMLGVSDIRSIFKEVERVQHEATIKMASTCPAITPTSPLAVYGSEAA
jgi:hypothetical protein